MFTLLIYSLYMYTLLMNSKPSSFFNKLQTTIILRITYSIVLCRIFHSLKEILAWTLFFFNKHFIDTLKVLYEIIIILIIILTILFLVFFISICILKIYILKLLIIIWYLHIYIFSLFLPSFIYNKCIYLIITLFILLWCFNWNLIFLN